MLQVLILRHFVGNSFTNYQRYQKHLKEIHEVHGFEIIENSAAIKHFVPGNDTTIKMEKCDEYENISSFLNHSFTVISTFQF